MGIILVPLFLAMLVGFSYLGIRSSLQAVLAARGRLTAVVFLATTTAVFAIVGIVLPFAVLASRRVPTGSVVMYAFAIGGVATLAGTFLMQRYRATGKPVAGLCAAAIFFAAALFPINWFWWADRARAWFHVTWSY